MDPITIGAVGWSVAIVGWVASAAISKLLSKGFDYLGYDVSKKLEELEQKVLVLERVKEIVETSPYRPRLEKLFQELKSAFYEAEDILDAIEYNRLKTKIQDEKRSRAKKLWSTVARTFLLKNMESGMSNKKLIKSLKKIECIVNEGYQILDKLGLSTGSSDNKRQKMAYSYVTSASPEKVIGRDDSRNMIIEMLHEKEGDIHPSTSNDRCYSVIVIHGIGGSGKSTLAQFIFAQEKKDKKDKKEGHFDLLMWVDVSQNFSVDIIWKKMFEAAAESKVPCPEFNNMDVLEEELKEKLGEKRFFLVLDDVLCKRDVIDHDQYLPMLLSPLRVGKKGSKILVTTRNKNVLSDIGPGVRKTSIPVPDFDDSAFFELFMYYALEDGQDRSMTFHNIGAEIAKKLKGSPLAARTVGGILRQRQEINHWITVKNQNLFNVWMGPLWWSYYQLSEQARRCFAYCTIFPRRHFLYRDELVKLWMAEGFIGSTDRGKDMEDVGLECFNELVSTSFVQLGGKDYSGNDYYLVHDLLYDLAETVAGSDCFRIENDSVWRVIHHRRECPLREVPRDVRHLFINWYDEKLISGNILELENLRTLIIYHVGWHTPVKENVIENICKRLKKLRVLAIAFGPTRATIDLSITLSDVYLLPESIRQLKHLRYLAFRASSEWRVILPSRLSELYNLQLVDFGQCQDMLFPSSGLINLRHVLCGSDIPNVSRLLSLQTIPHFTVRNEKGYEVRQLRDLNKIHGTLSIHGLENVKSKEEALDANLAAKERLTELHLYWSGDANCNQDVEADILETMCPPMGLKILTIYGYKGSRYPNWMVGKHNGGPKDLQELWLHDFILGTAPELVAFIHLRCLVIWECSWDALPGDMEHLRSLEDLNISYCLNLRSLPVLPQSLKMFRLAYCNDELMKDCQTVGHEYWQKIEHVPTKTFY